MVTPRFHSNRGQRGAALAVALIILLVMTILAVSMSQTTRLQERVAGNARDMSVAQQALESALRAGETDINEASSRAYCASGCVVKPPNYYFKLSTPVIFAETDHSWWTSNGKEFGVAASKDMTAAHDDPRYIIEYRGAAKIGGSLAVDAPSRSFYTITAESTGVVEDTQLIATTVFTRND